MQALLTKIDYAKYPFTSEASAYIRSRNIDPVELTTPELLPILERAKDRVEQGIFAGKISGDLTQEDVDILAYPTALMIISSIGDDRTRRRYALAEAKRSYELLRNEPPEKMLQIAVGTFEWDAQVVNVDLGGTRFEFYLHFTDYVRNSVRMRDVKWKLVNRVLSRGYVLLPREDFARLLQEEIQARILQRTSESTAPFQPVLEKHVTSLRSRIIARAQYLAAEDLPREVVAEAMPPCMKDLLSQLQASKHISHMGRFAVAAFLLSIGTAEDTLLDMFKAFTDFDERIARYQVEHIAGKRGSRRKYTPPNCATMQRNGLCVNPDDICATVRHPLSYYRKSARRPIRRGARRSTPNR